MQISRHAAAWEQEGRPGRLETELDLLPTLSWEALADRLAQRRKLPGRRLEDYFTGLLQKRLGQTVLRAAGCGPLTNPAASLTPTRTSAGSPPSSKGGASRSPAPRVWPPPK